MKQSRVPYFTFTWSRVNETRKQLERVDWKITECSITFKMRATLQDILCGNYDSREISLSIFRFYLTSLFWKANYARISTAGCQSHWSLHVNLKQLTKLPNKFNRSAGAKWRNHWRIINRYLKNINFLCVFQVEELRLTAVLSYINSMKTVQMKRFKGRFRKMYLYR